MTSTDTHGARAPAAVLRRMRWWDVDPVVQLDAELFGPTAWTAAMLWSELSGVPQSRDYLVAVDGKVVVGYGGLMTASGESTIQTIGVAPSAQRTGLGRRILDELVAAARRRASTWVWLEVSVENAGAQRLYTAAGFEPVARRRDYYDVGRDAVVMRCRLTGRARS